MKAIIILYYFWLMVAIVCTILTFILGGFYAFPAIVGYFLSALIKDAVVRINEKEEE